jgi:hypothetical protein
MAARRFLWVVAGLIVLVLAGAFTYRAFEDRLLRAAMVPTASFEETRLPDTGPNYALVTSWIARPDIPNHPATWLPTGYQDEGEPPAERAAVFFIHPTSYLERERWNAPVDDTESQDRARLFVRHQASVFNGIADIWAPKYRQATFGAFLTTQEDALKALDFAYNDVDAAFGAFLASTGKDRPIILAAHSQGSLHLTRLLRERIAGQPVAKRVVAAYVIGWPISTVTDLPTLGLPACETAASANCILSWQSFADPADPKMIKAVYDASVAPNGAPRAGTPMLCTNPLTGASGAAAPATANLGTLLPNAALTEAEMAAGRVPARCDESGFLLIGSEEALPDLPPYVLPGNNYHVFDYALFWANLRADAARRLAAFLNPEEAPEPSSGTPPRT